MLPFSFYFASSSSCSAPTRDSQLPQTNPNPEQEAEPEQELIPALPNDVALNCLARVLRSHHPTLSLVSKPISSLLSSSLFIKAYSALHPNELVLYLLLYSRSSSKWFTLSLNPLSITPPLPLPPIPSPAINPSYALLGHNIYVIGGNRRRRRSPLVWVLDCSVNRWRRGPIMLVPRQESVAAVLGGKIYVMGGCKPGASIWAEVLDPAIGSWEELVRPYQGEARSFSCGARDGKLYVGSKFAYDPKNGVWESIKYDAWFGLLQNLCLDGGHSRCCRFSYRINGLEEVREGGIRGLDRVLPWGWRLKGAMPSAAGKMFLVWALEWGDGKQQNEVWCSQVEVYKNNEDGELWATLCWSQKILSLSEYFVERCFAVDL